MRQIKFRAWDLKRKKMIHFAEKGICSEYNQLTFDVQEKEEKEYLGCLPENDNILMQFTGLLDKNSKEIYEGDILKGGYKVEYRYDCFVVEYEKDDFASINWLSSKINGNEIIGNIYENPELLLINPPVQE